MTPKTFLVDLWRSKKAAWRLARMLIIACIIGVLALMLFENHLIFFPGRFSPGDAPYSWRLADGRTVEVEEVLFDSGDNTRLCGWYYSTSAKTAVAKPSHIILFCHGNAGHLADRHQKSANLCGLGVDLFIFDYRGYGKSDGSPDEKGVCMDGRAAWNVLLKRGWRPDQIIIYGKSLGGSVAIDLAGEVECAALVTESTYTSIPDMAAVAYPFIPRFLIRTKLNSASKIGAISVPKLFMHGEKDEMIPVAMARELFDRADDPKSLVLFPDGDHNDVYYQPNYLDVWRSFLGTTLGITPPGVEETENTGEN